LVPRRWIAEADFAPLRRFAYSHDAPAPEPPVDATSYGQKIRMVENVGT
jgi:hypothetical protein